MRKPPAPEPMDEVPPRTLVAGASPAAAPGPQRAGAVAIAVLPAEPPPSPFAPTIGAPIAARFTPLDAPEPRGAATLDGPTSPAAPSEPRWDAARFPLVEPDSYSIDGHLAQGGIGRIFRARDRRLERPVAVKELIEGGDGVAEERFVREALLTARLQHPSIVPVYEAGRWPSGEPFYAMKLVSGRTLTEVIDGAATLEQRLALLPHVLAVVEAIAYAHSERIIHRDLKPANVLIGPFGETVVIDWGLAKDLAEDAPEAPSERDAAPSARTAAVAALTMVGTIMGTPAYMPPEQATGRPVDERADVYALGAILYHLLAGAPPYDDCDDPLAIVRAVIAGPPSPLQARQ